MNPYLITILLLSAASNIIRIAILYKTPAEVTTCNHLPGHQNITLTQAMQDRFIGALNMATIAYDEHKYSPNETLQLIEFIEKSFPELHKSSFVTREFVSNYSLLYTIKGSDPSLRPYLLTSHMDVVPTVNSLWSSNPFNATLKEDGNIYARGTIDAKHLLMSMLEAFEFLLKQGFKPRRGFYMVFGHDEEVSGLEGAQVLAPLIHERLKAANYDKLEYILDEGNVIISDRFPGVDYNVALIGVVEKGMMSVKISTVGGMGHGSMPPAETAISKLGRIIGKFHATVTPSYFGSGVECEMLQILAKYATWPYKFIYGNHWLLRPVFNYIFSTNPALNGIIRTSTAVTMIKGGTKVNVLPDSASAIVNHRIHQLESIEKVTEFDKNLINDPTVQLELHGNAHNPSPVAPYDKNAYGFQLIKLSAQQVNPNTIVIPSVFLAASDSRWYTRLTDSIYKFSAITITLQETKLFHGHDERISVKNYEKLINFYHHLMLNSNEPRVEFEAPEHDEL